MKEFYKKATELDILKSMANPGVQDLERLLKIIQEDETLTVYFYENNNNGAWLRLLKEAREFETLGNADNVGPKERLKAIYLAEVAGEKPEELLDIIGRIDAKDVFIQGSFLDALLKMPVDKAVLGTSIVKSYLEGRDAKIWYFVGQRAAQIMVDFAEKHANEAFEIAEALLEVWKPGDKKRSRLREIEAKFEPFEYENLVFKYYKKLWDMYPFQAAMLLVQIFERYLKEIQGDKDYEVSSLFYISLERLDRIERIGGDVVAVIVAGICETGKVVIEKRPEKIDELLDYLRELEKHIFERIEMYLLRFVPAGTQRERMSDIIKKRKFLETPGYEYEYKLLLRDKFEDVDSGSKKFFEDWIADQKLDDGDKERISSWFKERETRDATAEDFERIENSRKARELFLVKEKYPKLYEGCKKKSGASDEELAPKPRIGPARAIAPTEGAPISVEDMVKMKPVEAVAYVGDPSRWVIDRKKESVFHTPEEGLASTFKEVVKQRATDYAELSADDLMKLKPSFLSKYFYGLWEVEREKKIQESSLVKVIRQAKAIIDSKGDSEEYKECFKAILDIVQGTLDNDESKEKIVKSNKQLVWEIVEPLVKYEYNPNVIIGEDSDPYTECINSVQGKAFELVIRFGVILKNENEEAYEGELSEKIVEILTYVLEEVTLEKVICVFGIWLTQLYWLEEGWVVANIDKIFDDEKWDVMWGSYMSWGRTYKKVFELLAEHEKYKQAVEKIGSTTKYKYGKDPEESLAEHLMIAFFNGWIEFEDSLLERFFEKAPTKLRGHGARFLTTGFAPLKENPDKEAGARLKHYWEMRFEVISKNPEANMNEAVEFLGWVKDSPIKTKETFELLYKTLELTNGQLGEGKSIYDFMEGIYDIAKGHELMALRCMSKAMNDEHMAGYFSLYEEKTMKFMESIVELPDDYPNVEDIRKEALSLADAYGRRHIYKLRTIYEQLVNKVGRNRG